VIWVANNLFYFSYSDGKVWVRINYLNKKLSITCFRKTTNGLEGIFLFNNCDMNTQQSHVKKVGFSYVFKTCQVLNSSF